MFRRRSQTRSFYDPLLSRPNFMHLRFKLARSRQDDTLYSAVQSLAVRPSGLEHANHCTKFNKSLNYACKFSSARNCKYFYSQTKTKTKRSFFLLWNYSGTNSPVMFAPDHWYEHLKVHEEHNRMERAQA